MAPFGQKRALLLTDVAAPGGIDTYMCGLYREAVKAGWSVTVMIDTNKGANRLATMLGKLGAPTLRAPMYHRVNNEDVQRNATQAVINVARPDVVHAVCGAPWQTLVPREVTLTNKLPLVFTEQFVSPGFSFDPDTHARLRNLYRKSKKVIAVSRISGDLLRGEYGLDGNIQVIPNPVPLTSIEPISKDETRRIHRSLGLMRRDFQAITVARCAEQKGLDILVKAIVLLPAAVRNRIHFSVFGDGPDRRALIDLACSLGVDDTISFLGWRSKVRKILPAFDLFVLPSRQEGQPLALAEALAATRPVIATKVSGIPEMLDNGAGGDLIRSESPEALAEAMEKFIENPTPLRVKAEYGFRYVRRYHSAAKNLARTVRLWE